MVVKNRRSELRGSGVPSAVEPCVERGRAQRVGVPLPCGRITRRAARALTADRPAGGPLDRCPDRDWTTWPRLVIVLTMTTFSLADAKAHLSKLVAQVSGQHERVYVTVHGKPLRLPLDDRHSARRGTYRVIYRIDDNSRTVTVLDVAHRRDAYRP